MEEDIRYVKDTPIYVIKNPVPILTSYRSAVNDLIHNVRWQEAAERELNTLAVNDIFEIIKRPKDTNLVTAKWVWAVKYTSNQLIERYKVRLVARGFTQIHGVDY